MRKRLLNNFGLKLLSVLCAILLWGIIVNVNDPSDKATVSNINVVLTNTNILTDNGYLYEVVNSSDKISIEVKGPRSVVEGLKASDFYAEAAITNEFSNTAKIEVQCINPNIKASDLTITLQREEVQLDIQNLVTETFNVEAVFTGSPAEGYYVDSSLISISPTSIRISGPANIIEQISSVRVTYDLTGENDTITASVVPMLYNENGRNINASKLTFSKNAITYKVNLLKKKTLDVSYAVSGVVKEGYKYTSISSTMPTVTIAGTPNEIARIDSIDIPASLIDLTGLSGDAEFTIPVSQYVPSNMKFIGEETKSNVLVTIQKLEEKKISLSNSKIAVENLATNHKLQFLDNTNNSVVIRGIASDLEGFSIDDLEAQLDLTGLKAGEHSVTIKLTTKKNVEVVGTYKVNIRLVEEKLLSSSDVEEEYEY